MTLAEEEARVRGKLCLTNAMRTAAGVKRARKNLFAFRILVNRDFFHFTPPPPPHYRVHIYFPYIKLQCFPFHAVCTRINLLSMTTSLYLFFHSFARAS